MPVLTSAGGSGRAFLAAAAAFLLIAPFPSSAGWRVFCLIAAAAALVWQAQTLRVVFDLRRVPGPLAAAGLAWAGLCIASLAWSVNPDYTLDEARRELLYGLGVFVLFFLGTREARDLYVWIGTLFFGALLLGLGEWLNGFFPGVYLFRKSSIGPGPLSTHVLMLAPLLLLCARGAFDARAWPRALVALATLVLLGAGLAGESRMLWTALLVSASVAFMLFVARADPADPARKLARRAFIAAAVALPLLLLVSAESKLRYYPRAESATAALAFDERPVIWRIALSKLAERPWIGHGYGREIIEPDMRKGLAQSGSTKRFGHGHNVFLDAALELGAIGVVAFTFLVGAIAWCYWRLREDRDTLMLAIVGLALLAGYLAKNMTDDFFHRPNSLVFWAINGALLGLATSRALGLAGRSSRDGPEKGPSALEVSRPQIGN